MKINGDFSNADQQKKFELIPDGDYEAIIYEIKSHTSQAGNKGLNLTFMITSGDYRQRRLFNYFSLTGSDKAVSIGRSGMRAILEALSMPLTQGFDTDVVTGKGLIISIYTKEEEDQRNNTKKTVNKIGYIDKKVKEEGQFQINGKQTDFDCNSIPF